VEQVPSTHTWTKVREARGDEPRRGNTSLASSAVRVVAERRMTRGEGGGEEEDDDVAGAPARDDATRGPWWY
jgi:hypothetical protein